MALETTTHIVARFRWTPRLIIHDKSGMGSGGPTSGSPAVDGQGATAAAWAAPR
jgi:hypothetical protein